MTRDHMIIAGLCVAGGLALIAACLLGSTPMSPDRFLAALFFAGGLPGDELVIWSIRMPRALSAYYVGLALGASGAALQGLLRNPLADPAVLGVSATSSLAATFVIYYGFVGFSAWLLPFAAILGALAATSFLMIVALRNASIVTLILVGVALSSFSGAAMSLLLNLAPNPFSLADLVSWMLGSVANRSFEDILYTGPFIGAGLGVLLLTRRGLSALTLGEEAASGIGLDLKRQRILTVIGAGLATGGSVALAGAIGFVGIVVPHIIRPLVHHDPARTILPSALLAGLILVLADIGVRLLPTTNELRLGVLAALIGAPAFAWIAAKRRGANG